MEEGVSTNTKQLLKQFLPLLQESDNERTDVQRVMDFLSRMLRVKGSEPPPVAELITLLKHRRPSLYRKLKSSVSSTSPLHFVLHLDMNYDAVVERLGLQDEAFGLNRGEKE